MKLCNHLDNVDQASNYLVLLVEAAFKVLFLHKNYTLHLYPLAFLVDVREVEIVERAFNECLNAKAEVGGFCVASAGQCSSASNVN